MALTSVKNANGSDAEHDAFLAELDGPAEEVTIPTRIPPNVLQDFAQEGYEATRHLRDAIRSVEVLRGYTASADLAADLRSRGISEEGVRSRLQSFEHRLEVELSALKAFLFGQRS